jgi:hypothetical protein
MEYYAGTSASPNPLPAILKANQTMKKIVSVLTSSIVLTGCAVRLTEEKTINLKNELDEMVKVDQIATKAHPNGNYSNYTQEQWYRFRDSVHTNIKIRVETMFNEYGFLGYNKVGKEGSKHFWLLVQHSDNYPEFQNKVLKAMNKEVKKGTANPSDYAYLYDRVKVKAGEKQKFGTQLSYDSAGRPFAAIGLIDSVNVDKYRKAYELEPLKDYYQFIIDSRNQKN